ncbi:class I SAM-dependent methyltransferase [Patulibacter minatonensis]|uniref:class I SAM-dependent methyltransferase n=1 Tax=Patulibacter minatonensis TaxID=298163 RepID=UPI0006879BE5|nr:class I SAM-dependent methyltransferase [Patulibacter minatonensis]
MTADDDPELHRIVRFWDARAREDAVRYSVPGGTAIGDDAFRAAGEAVLDALERDLGWSAQGAGRVLDLGCGAGRLTGALADVADEVVAVDASSRMIEAARTRLGELPDVSWQTTDVGDLVRLPDDVADAALCIGVLPHLPTAKHVAAAIAEFGRVLQSGGAVAFDVRSGVAPLRLPGEDDLPPHVTGHPLWSGVVVDLETVAAVAHQSGLVVERIEGSGTARSLVLARREER